VIVTPETILVIVLLASGIALILVGLADLIEEHRNGKGD